MKKFPLFLLLSVCMIIAFSACGEENIAEGTPETFFQEYLTNIESTSENRTEVSTVTEEYTETENKTESENATVSTAESLEFEMRNSHYEAKSSNGILVYKSDVSYPYFLGNSAAEKAINARFEEVIKNCQTKTSEEIEEWYSNTVENGTEFMFPYYQNVSAKVTYNRNGYISIYDDLVDWSGGGHPYTYQGCVTYRISTGEQCEAIEFIDSFNAGTVRTFLFERFAAAYGEGATVEQSDSLLECSYVLNDEGLCFYYLTGFAEPRLEVLIPYTDENSPIINCDEAMN